MDISVIIVNYNVKEYIISCIDSIYKHSKSDLKFEIIVVDNNSIDNSVIDLKKTFPNVILVENNYNAGFSVAVNQGAKLSNSNFFLILNPDTLFVEDSLSILYNEVLEKKIMGAIGPKLISKKGLLQQSFWRDPTLINTILSISYLDFLNFSKKYIFTNFTKTSKVDTISGAAIFIPRRIFDQLEGFDSRLFWMEDIDLCVRLRRKKFVVCYSPLTKIIHFSGKSASKNFKVAIINQLISKIKFFKKNHNEFETFILSSFILFISTVKSLLFSVIAILSTKNREKLKGYLTVIHKVINGDY